jgi:hypothetical protein
MLVHLANVKGNVKRVICGGYNAMLKTSKLLDTVIPIPKVMDIMVLEITMMVH